MKKAVFLQAVYLRPSAQKLLGIVGGLDLKSESVSDIFKFLFHSLFRSSGLQQF